MFVRWGLFLHLSFFWSQCTPSVKSLFQLSAPLRLIEPGCLPKRLSVHQSVSGECGRFFVVNFLSSISQTIPQEPYSLISPLYVAFSSDGLGQSQTEDAFDTGSVTESAGIFLEKGFFLFSSPGQSQSPEQVLMEQFEETAGKDQQPPSSEMEGSALTLLRPLLIECCCCSAAGWKVGSGLPVFIRGANSLLLAEIWARYWGTFPCSGQQQQRVTSLERMVAFRCVFSI